MATLDETLAELKDITKALADHAIGNARSPAHSAHGALARLAPPDDFVPAQTNAESYAAELVRHKGMLAQQRVGFVPPKADAAKPVAQEPQRTTGLTVATAARTIPSSSIIYVNTKAFNIETCNATNNIKNFMMQVPGRIMSMVRIDYDDPTIEQLLSMTEGDLVLIRPGASKPDQVGLLWGDKPVALPYHAGDLLNLRHRA